MHYAWFEYNFCPSSWHETTQKPSGVSYHWTGIWTGLVEWTMEWTKEYLCTADSTISHCVLASFVPFHSVRPQKILLNCK